MSMQIGEPMPCPYCGGEMQVRLYDEDFYRAVLGTEYEYEPEYEVEHVDRLAAVLAKCPLEMECYKSEAEAIAAWNTRAERTCRVESVSLIDWWEYTPADYYEFEMECGGCFKWDWREPPDYCPNCGAKVVSE